MMFPLVGTRFSFSPDMTPDQLEQWLLDVYGEPYKPDISKMKGIYAIYYRAIYNLRTLLSAGFIDGKLFLELPNDKELLDGLKLDTAFKDLVKKKAKEVRM